MAWRHQAALDHAAKLVMLILHGDPQIDEPLAIAWQRALRHFGMSDTAQERYLRVILADLPGDTENAKIAGVFSSAPSWLLDSAWLRWIVLYLGLSCRSEPAPERGRDGLRDMKSWPDLPSGTIAAGRRIPKPNPMHTLSAEERIYLIRLLKSGEENWSRRDRHRHSEIMAKLDRTDTASN